MINLKMKKKRIVITVAAVAWLCCMPITGATLWFACTAIASAVVSLYYCAVGFFWSWFGELVIKCGGNGQLSSIERRVLKLGRQLLKDM